MQHALASFEHYRIAFAVAAVQRLVYGRITEQHVGEQRGRGQGGEGRGRPHAAIEGRGERVILLRWLLQSPAALALALALQGVATDGAA